MPAKKVNVRAQKMQRQTDRQAGSQAGRAVDSSARALFLLFRPWLALHTSLWHATAHVGGARPGSLDWATGQPHALSLSLFLSLTHTAKYLWRTPSLPNAFVILLIAAAACQEPATPFFLCPLV